MRCLPSYIHTNTTQSQLCCVIYRHPFANQFKPLAPGRCGNNLRCVALELSPWVDTLSTLYIKQTTLKRMSQTLTDDKSTLVQLMARCRQATNDNLSQCWPRSMSPYDVNCAQWVNNTEARGYITYRKSHKGKLWTKMLQQKQKLIPLNCIILFFSLCLQENHYVCVPKNS